MSQRNIQYPYLCYFRPLGVDNETGQVMGMMCKIKAKDFHTRVFMPLDGIRNEAILTNEISETKYYSPVPAGFTVKFYQQ